MLVSCYKNQHRIFITQNIINKFKNIAKDLEHPQPFALINTQLCKQFYVYCIYLHYCIT